MSNDIVAPGTRVLVGLNERLGLKLPGIVLARVESMESMYYIVSWWNIGTKHEGNLMREEFEIMVEDADETTSD